MERGRELMQNKPPLSIDVQVRSLRESYPLGQFALADDLRLRWFCNLRPAPLADNYFVQFDYALGGIPHARVVAPCLVVPAGERLPHVFPDGAICIYDCRAGKDEWNPRMPLADIVPWAELWLYYYETWLVTGEWYGKEAKH
jgi:hypothetical protein